MVVKEMLLLSLLRRVSSHPMGHHYSGHASLFEFRPWVHQVSWCWWWIVDTHSFIDLVRDSIFEEFFSFKHKLWFVIWMIKFHMFMHWIVFSSPICASIMLFLTAVQASARPSFLLSNNLQTFANFKQCSSQCWLICNETVQQCLPFFFFFFSCPGQLNRWHCQSVSEWVSERLLISPTLVDTSRH